MARYTLTTTSITPTATADTTNLVDSTYMAILQGGVAAAANVPGQRLAISEVYMGGEAASTSSPSIMVLARDSTVGATVTAGTCRNAVMDPGNTAPGTVATFGHIATTKPQRSATLHLLHLSFNAYGGIVRWVARPGEEIIVQGATASLGEVSLSAFTGGTPGQMSSHIIYEVL
jgi:hypothetical protein